MHRVAHNRSAGSCTRIWYIHARSEFSDSHQPAIYGRARKRTRAVIRKASYRPGTVEESNLDIIIIATTEPRTRLSIFRLLRNRAKEIRKRFLSRRCSIIQTKKNKETIERIGSNQGLNASLPIVYRRRVTPRSSLLHIYIYIYTFIREWRSDKLAIGGQRTEKYILRETGDYRTTMARGKDYGLRPQSHSDSALRRCAWPLIQKWK